jgi:hypothetical protein
MMIDFPDLFYFTNAQWAETNMWWCRSSQPPLGSVRDLSSSAMPTSSTAVSWCAIWRVHQGS